VTQYERCLLVRGLWTFQSDWTVIFNGIWSTVQAFSIQLALAYGMSLDDKSHYGYYGDLRFSLTFY